MSLRIDDFIDKKKFIHKRDINEIIDELTVKIISGEKVYVRATIFLYGVSELDAGFFIAAAQTRADVCHARKETERIENYPIDNYRRD